MSHYPTPRVPTAQQCSDRAAIEVPGIPGHPGVPARAFWWPQMGGYHGRAVATIGDCSELWLWHDGQFPTHDGGTPQQIHLDSYQDWIDTFTWLQEQYDIEFNYGPLPYVLDLPPGVTREEAEQVHAKAVEWGMWGPDPGGFVIRTHEEQLAARKPCTPQPCPPPWQDAGFSIEPLIDEAARPLDDGDSEYTPQSHPTAMVPRMYEVAPDQTLPDGTTARGAWLRGGQDEGVVYLDDSARLAPDAKVTLSPDVKIGVDPTFAGDEGRVKARGVFKWMDIAIPWEGELPPDIARSFFPGLYSLAPEVDVEQMLEQSLRAQTHPIYPEFPSPNYPHATDGHPLIVSVPTDIDVQKVSEAIALCQQVGLLAPTPQGVVYLPAEMDLRGDA